MSTVTMRRIKALRLAAGKSQRELAAAAGVDASYICNAERYGMLYPGHAAAVASALEWGGNPQELVEMVEFEEAS